MRCDLFYAVDAKTATVDPRLASRIGNRCVYVWFIKNALFIRWTFASDSAINRISRNQSTSFVQHLMGVDSRRRLPNIRPSMNCCIQANGVFLKFDPLNNNSTQSFEVLEFSLKLLCACRRTKICLHFVSAPGSISSTVLLFNTYVFLSLVKYIYTKDCKQRASEQPTNKEKCRKKNRTKTMMTMKRPTARPTSNNNNGQNKRINRNVYDAALWERAQKNQLLVSIIRLLWM